MKPLSIEIEGLRSFRSARRIDFSDLSLFAILGDTGAGKSSILEAIVYALFNGSTWDGRSVKDLMTTGAPRMRVRFEFAIDGVKYAVTRITPSTGLAIHLLECDEKPADRRDGEALVAKKLEELLKVKREEFFKTVVLPQGKFAALLEMSKGDRAKFLVDVLGLSILDEMNAQLSGPRTRLQLHTSSLRGKRSAIADDPLAALTEASDKVDAATEAETLLRKAVDLVAKEQQNLDEIGRRAKARNGVRSEIGTVPDTLVVLDSLVSSGKVLQSQLASLGDEREQSRAELAALQEQMKQRESEGLDVVSLSDVQRVLQQLDGEHREYLVGVRDLKGREKACQDAATSLKAGEAEFQAARIAADLARLAANDAEMKRAGASQAYTAGQAASLRLQQDRASLAAGREKVHRAAKSVGHCEDALKVLRASFEEAKARLEAAEDALSRGNRAEAATAASEGLKAGDDCPICARTLPNTFKPPVGQQTDVLRAQVTGSQSASNEAQRQLTLAEAAAQQCGRELEAAKADVERSAAAYAAAKVAAISTGITPGSSEASDLSVLLGQLELASSEETLQREELGRQALAQENAEILMNVAKGAFTQASLEVRNAAGRLETRREAVAELRPKIPPSFLAKDTIISEEAIAAASTALQKALAASNAIQTAINLSIAAVDTITAKFHALQERYSHEILAPVSVQLGLALRAWDALAEANLLPHTLLRLSASQFPPDVYSWACELAAATSAALATLLEQDAVEVKAAAAAESAIAGTLESHGVSTLNGLQTKREEAIQQLGSAKEQQRERKSALLEARKLDERLEQLDPTLRALDVLSTFLSGAKFKKYVTDRKQERLLGVATTVLRRMTTDQYGFSSSMNIVDLTAGRERAAATLSGGEKFLASLALALALVEIAARSGRHFEALFLDEGFGSLDPQALDQALSELDRQSNDGRMIGVITHVHNVVEYIDDVLRVTKTAAGSEVSRLTLDEIDVLARGSISSG